MDAHLLVTMHSDLATRAVRVACARTLVARDNCACGFGFGWIAFQWLLINELTLRS